MFGLWHLPLIGLRVRVTFECAVSLALARLMSSVRRKRDGGGSITLESSILEFGVRRSRDERSCRHERDSVADWSLQFGVPTGHSSQLLPLNAEPTSALEHERTLVSSDRQDVQVRLPEQRCTKGEHLSRYATRLKWHSLVVSFSWSLWTSSTVESVSSLVSRLSVLHLAGGSAANSGAPRSLNL